MAILALAGCQRASQAEAPKPAAERMTWCGRQAGSLRDSVPADTAAAGACIRIHRLEFPGTEVPFRVELREYRRPYWAFAAWQALAQGRTQEGFARIGPRWAFVHGAFLGWTDSSAANLYPEEFKERLAFAGEPAIGLPSQFDAFPLLGRIPASERLFLRDFLGGTWPGPIFSVAYHCHGDTALAFRGFAQDPDSLAGSLSGSGISGRWTQENGFLGFGKEKEFQGRDAFGQPLILRIFRGGILGFSGCYDSNLGQEYAEKMRKMQVFWHDP